jgi:hypothetical protein
MNVSGKMGPVRCPFKGRRDERRCAWDERHPPTHGEEVGGSGGGRDEQDDEKE